MPRGVYERKPYMRSAGRTRGQHDYIRSLRAGGAAVSELARAFRVGETTIKTIVAGTGWNPGRGFVRSDSGVIRCHDHGRATCPRP